MANRIDWIQQELSGLKEAGLYNRIRTLSSAQGAWLEVDGKRVLNFCSNNYLGLANHPKLVQAVQEIVTRYGVGPAAVRTIAGTMDIHLELERRLAAFKGVEAAITFQSGFTANLATIPALVGKEDVIFSDELNHASIIDGARLSGARILRFAHADPLDLEQVIKSNEGSYRRGLIVTDGVFSMDGDIAPLDKICEIANAYDILLMVDDAHGEGVLGDGGRGIVSHYHLTHEQVHIEMGTFSKAYGVVGGHISGSEDLVRFALNKSRTWLLSGSHPPAVAAACIAAIDVLEQEPEHVLSLWENTRYFKKAMRELGFDIGRSETPITPIMVGDSSMAKRLSQRLFEEQVFALPIVFPMVAKDRARIRTIMNATLTKEDLDFAIEKFSIIGRELKLIA